MPSACSQFASQEFNLLTDPGVAIEQDHLLSLDSAAAAFGAVTGFAQELFAAHFDVESLRLKNQFLQACFVFVLSGRHGSRYQVASDYGQNCRVCKPKPVFPLAKKSFLAIVPRVTRRAA